MASSNDALLSRMFDGDTAAPAAPAAPDTTSETTGDKPVSEEQTTSPKTGDGETKTGDNPAGDEKVPPTDTKTGDETSETAIEAKGDQKTDEGGESKPAEETGGDEDQGHKVKGLTQAVQAERKGRRDWKEKAIRAEGENTELRRRLDAIEARTGDAEKSDDAEPENQTSAEYYLDPVKHNAELVRKIVKEEREAVDKQDQIDLADRSAEAARKKYGNYDEVEASFLKEMNANSYLLGSLQKHGAKDPSEWLYRFMTETLPALNGDAKPAKEAAPAIDEEALRKEIREELKREKRGDDAATAAAGMPKSQVGALSSGAKPRRLPSNSEQLTSRMFADRR